MGDQIRCTLGELTKSNAELLTGHESSQDSSCSVAWRLIVGCHVGHIAQPHLRFCHAMGIGLTVFMSRNIVLYCLYGCRLGSRHRLVKITGIIGAAKSDLSFGHPVGIISVLLMRGYVILDCFDRLSLGC